MRSLKKLSCSIILGVVVFFSVAAPALAAEEPTTVSLTDIEIIEGVITAGDFLALVPYQIEIGTVPDENIDEAFVFRFMSPDGSTENGSVVAVTQYTGGWGRGLVSFYFESGMTTGLAYVIRVQQNPVVYPAADYWDFTIDSSNYSSANDTSAAVKAEILANATILTTEFNTALTETSEAGSRVLNAFGELYYLAAVPGLQNMCPECFGVELENPDYTKRSWSHSFALAMRGKYNGTFIGEFFTGYAGMFALETNAAMTVFSILMAAILIAISVWKFKANMLAATTDGYCLLLLLMLGGVFPMEAAGGVAFAAIVLGGVILLLNRS